MKRVALVFVLLFNSGLLADDHLVNNEDELVRAIKAARPGDSVVLANGVWIDTHIKFYGNGEESKPITLRGQAPGRVSLVGQSRLSIGGSWLVVDGLLFT